MPAKRHQTSGRTGEGSSQELASRTAALMLDKKALEVTIMDVRGLTTITDFFVICTGESDVQVKVIADHISEVFKREGNRPSHIEGYDRLSWVLIDCIDVVAHVFLRDTRSYYGLERLWADARVTTMAESDT